MKTCTHNCVGIVRSGKDTTSKMSRLRAGYSPILGAWLLSVVLAAGLSRAFCQDTDGDGLSDFQEVHKYFTDSHKKCTNGKPDGDWDQRREFTYSIRTVLRVMKPYDLAAMNDDYQDARLLRETAEYGEIEVIHYPLNTNAEAIGANEHWRTDDAKMQEWLKPGITADWTPALREKLLKELRVAGIEPDRLNDRELAERVAKWMYRSTKSPKMFTTYYMDFSSGRPAVLAGCERAFERDKGDKNWTFDEQIQHELLGSGMFVNKTRGSCTSTAIYWTTILRALGLPTRLILCIPAVNATDPAQLQMVEKNITHHQVRATMLQNMRNQHGFTAHTFNEVFIGGRWVRLNYSKLGQNILDAHCFGLHTHILTFRDLSEAHLAETWGKRYALGRRSQEFPGSNPYTVLEISDHFGAHAKIPNPEVAISGDHHVLTIDRAYWHRSAECPEWLKSKSMERDEKKGVIALLHPAERFPDQNYTQYRRFLNKCDGAFTLRAPGQPDIPARLSGTCFSTRDDCAIAMAVAQGDYDQMKAGVPYRLEPANSKEDAKWAVKESVRLAK